MTMRPMLDDHQCGHGDEYRADQEPSASDPRRPLIALADDVVHSTAQHAPIP
jgi:hypothetical protein